MKNVVVSAARIWCGQAGLQRLELSEGGWLQVRELSPPYAGRRAPRDWLGSSEPSWDLALAAGLLAQRGALDPRLLAGWVFFARVDDAGRIVALPGAGRVAEAAKAAGLRGLMLGGAGSLPLGGGLELLPLSHIAQLGHALSDRAAASGRGSWRRGAGSWAPRLLTWAAPRRAACATA